MKEIAIRDFYLDNKEILNLTIANSIDTINEKTIEKPGFHFPGVALAGHFSDFDASEIQLFGKSEVSFLRELKTSKDYYQRLKTFFLKNLPCIIVSDKLVLDEEVIIISNENRIPIFYSDLSQFELIKNLTRILNNYFVESFKLLGTFLEVYGIGVLLYGNEGIGKSETALALISRGHRFIADNLIKIKILNDVLVGYCNNNSFNLESSLMGSYQIDRMYGIERVSRYHKIDIVINLLAGDNVVKNSSDKKDFDTIVFRGVEVPKVNVPMDVGKDLSIIIESLVKYFLYQKINSKV